MYIYVKIMNIIVINNQHLKCLNNNKYNILNKFEYII